MHSCFPPVLIPGVYTFVQQLVKVTRQGVLGAVAGDRVIVPPTLTDALRTRANKMVSSFNTW